LTFFQAQFGHKSTMTTERKSAGLTLQATPGGKAASALKRLLSVEEAAGYLGISEWSIRQRIWNGTLPVVQLGRRTLLDRQDLDQFIAIRKSRRLEN
jgi:excisionase family DNA binding protein